MRIIRSPEREICSPEKREISPEISQAYIGEVTDKADESDLEDVARILESDLAVELRRGNTGNVHLELWSVKVVRSEGMTRILRDDHRGPDTRREVNHGHQGCWNERNGFVQCDGCGWEFIDCRDFRNRLGQIIQYRPAARLGAESVIA